MRSVLDAAQTKLWGLRQIKMAHLPSPVRRLAKTCRRTLQGTKSLRTMNSSVKITRDESDDTYLDLAAQSQARATVGSRVAATPSEGNRAMSN